MLAVLVAWISCVIVFMAIGNIFYDISERFFSVKIDRKVLDVFFVGLSMTGSCLTLWSLFLPTNHLALIVLLIISAFYGLLNLKMLIKKSVNHILTLCENKVLFVMAILALLGVIICSLLPPLVYDSALYHMQAIRWTENFRVVPGLGNLDARLAFNSSFIILSSVFTLREFFGQPVFAINSISVLFFVIWLINVISKNKSVFSIFLYTFILCLFTGFSLFFLSSPSMDILAVLLPLFILVRLIQGKKQIQFNDLYLWVIPLYCLTIKLNTLPLCLIVIILIFNNVKRKEFSTLFFVFIFACFIIIPWLIRNFILSGYLIYPYPGIDLFNPDWKMPIQNVTGLKNIIISWARVKGENYFEVASMPSYVWIPKWWILQPFYNKVFFILSWCSPVIIMWLYIKRKFYNISSNIFLAWLISFSGVCFWFYTAPSFRFGYAFIWISFLLPFCLIDNHLKKFKRYFTLGSYVMVAACIILISLWGLFELKKVSGIASETLFIKPNILLEYYPPRSRSENGQKVKFVTKTSETYNNVTVFIPDVGDLCFDHDIPCTAFLNVNLQARGPTLQNGFRIVKVVN